MSCLSPATVLTWAVLSAGVTQGQMKGATAASHECSEGHQTGCSLWVMLEDRWSSWLVPASFHSALGGFLPSPNFPNIRFQWRCSISLLRNSLIFRESWRLCFICTPLTRLSNFLLLTQLFNSYIGKKTYQAFQSPFLKCQEVHVLSNDGLTTPSCKSSFKSGLKFP